ncbi:hypothetical protein HDE68_001375 [Pedobacter cryoconitis]|uniref:Uncharacterized protein n=1 Tax=Pedobacter cryoconitis TaxID=188932 RepID=A0A7W8ZK40_9SPHI|nr:hypothetical protein [Pedobacter cryoconitis]
MTIIALYRLLSPENKGLEADALKKSNFIKSLLFWTWTSSYFLRLN